MNFEISNDKISLKDQPGSDSELQPGVSSCLSHSEWESNRLKCNPSPAPHLMNRCHSWHCDPVDVDVDTDSPQHPDHRLPVALLDAFVEDNLIRKSHTSHSWLSSGKETGSSWHLPRMSVSDGSYHLPPSIMREITLVNTEVTIQLAWWSEVLSLLVLSLPALSRLGGF